MDGHGDVMDGRTGIARSLTGPELAREVARQELAALRVERDAPPLLEAVRLAKAVGLSVAEMERMTGYSRQTLYNAIKRADAEPDAGTDASPHYSATLSRQMLVALVGAGGSVPLAELAHALGRDQGDAYRAAQALQARELCVIEGAGQALEVASLSATRNAERALRGRFDELFLARGDAFHVYVAVDPGVETEVADAAAQLISRHEHTVMDANVAPSVMRGPELALSIHAPTGRTALEVVRHLWDEISDMADLPRSTPEVTDIIFPTPAPVAESAVLDEFVKSIAEERLEEAATALHARERYAGEADERALAGRCLTAAARVLRRSLDQEHDPRPITNADAAWGELQPVRGLRLDAERERIREPLRKALELAAERLGPFPGGGLAAFRAPGQQPAVIDEVEPTGDDLERIAHLSGRAVGAAARFVDISAEVTRVVSGL